MRTVLICLSCFLMSSVLNAQGSESDYERNANVGMKLGIAVSTMYGKELKNPTPMMGYVAGLYIHNKLDKKNIHYQAGLDVSIRGGNFNNAKETDTASNRAYTKIGLITVDMPLVLLVNYGENSRTKHSHLLFGIQPSYILKSTAYMGPDQIPSNQTVTNQSWKNLDLKPIEILGLVGYRVKNEDYGYQIALKFSLNNINNGLNMKDLAPATGKGLSIYTGAIELSLVF